jgi:hypothetical protein
MFIGFLAAARGGSSSLYSASYPASILSTR